MKKLTLLWMENGRAGTAAGQHLVGTLQRLDEIGLPKPRVILSQNDHAEGWKERITRLVRLQLAAISGTGAEVCLIARWHPAALPVLLLQRWRGGRTVLLVQGNIADMHTAYPFTKHLPLDKFVIAPSLRAGHVHVAPNSGILDWVRDEVGVELRQSFVVENGFDGEAVAKVKPLNRDTLASIGVEEGNYAIFVGKFAAWQGIQTVLDAVQSDSWPRNLPLVFVGDGAELPAVKAVAKSTSRVKYVGRVSPTEALSWTASAAIALAPRNAGPASDRGVSPYKVLEASALGTPLVATRVKGQEDLIMTLQSGLLVTPESPSELVDAVALLWNDVDLRTTLSERDLYQLITLFLACWSRDPA